MFLHIFKLLQELRQGVEPHLCPLRQPLRKLDDVFWRRTTRGQKLERQGAALRTLQVPAKCIRGETLEDRPAVPSAPHSTGDLPPGVREGEAAIHPQGPARAQHQEVN